MHHSGWWPDYTVRLFRKKSGKFSLVPVHEKVHVEGVIGKLKNPLLHDTYETLEEAISKMNRYSTLSAKMLRDAEKKTSMGKALIRAFWTFIRTYLIKAGFLDGKYGLMLAILNAEGTFYKYAKLSELTNTYPSKD